MKTYLWLDDYCLDRNLDLPSRSIQSANPFGRNNINGMLNNNKKHKQQQ